MASAPYDTARGLLGLVDTAARRLPRPAASARPRRLRRSRSPQRSAQARRRATVDPARVSRIARATAASGKLHACRYRRAHGTLDAILLDAKGIFDGWCAACRRRRRSPSACCESRLRNVRAVRRSDAYMALEQLLDIVGPATSTVVVDTPPAATRSSCSTHRSESWRCSTRARSSISASRADPRRRVVGLARALLSAVLSASSA